jgi:hypothetical protein
MEDGLSERKFVAADRMTEPCKYLNARLPQILF